MVVPCEPQGRAPRTGRCAIAWSLQGSFLPRSAALPSQDHPDSLWATEGYPRWILVIDQNWQYSETLNLTDDSLQWIFAGKFAWSKKYTAKKKIYCVTHCSLQCHFHKQICNGEEGKKGEWSTHAWWKEVEPETQWQWQLWEEAEVDRRAHCCQVGDSGCAAAWSSLEHLYPGFEQREDVRDVAWLIFWSGPPPKMSMVHAAPGEHVGICGSSYSGAHAVVSMVHMVSLCVLGLTV